MKPSPYYDRIVDVMEELFKFTLLVRDRSDYLGSRYSERKGDLAAQALAVASGAVALPASAIAADAANDAAKAADTDTSAAIHPGTAARAPSACCAGACASTKS